jgi:NAD-dependent deacetylase
MAQTLDAAACADMIRLASRVTALTGAGVSTAAGIPDFRGPQGLYVTRRYDAERVFDIASFRRDPAPFFEFTRDFLSVVDALEPTATHRFLAMLEGAGRLHALITQNIDPLHHRAGSRRVIAVHGGYWTSHCLGCGRSYSLDEMREKVASEPVPRCACSAVVKPDVVFFGEMVHGLDEALAATASSDLMLVLGSSLTVYPAAWLPQSAGGDVVVVNRGPVGLAPGPRRFFVDADLDEFFAEVARHLGLEVGRKT